MALVVFQERADVADALSNYMDLYYGRQMKYLSSDLLAEGLQPIQIQKAVQKAIAICQTAEMELRQHFMPVYTEINGVLINDCKLSQLAYGLVLLNADIYNPVTAQWQIRLMNEFLSKHNSKIKRDEF